MKKNTIRTVGYILAIAIWFALAAAAWVHPSQEISESERRKLAQFPDLTVSSLVTGGFMSKFEDYTLDQFPLRDTFRQLKSLFHYDVLGQKDNNGIYIVDGYAAKLEYPLNDASVQLAANKFNYLYNTYLTGSEGRIWFAIAPDKGLYLAEDNGYLSLDYSAMAQSLSAAMPWAEYVDISGCLTQSDYYRTDTHWRQEHLLGVANKLGQAMDITIPEFSEMAIDRPFYGVYYGQAALPMEPESIHYLTNQVLDRCIVRNHETGAISKIYDMTKLNSRDLYDVFLSGAASLLTIENPSAATDRELIVFRDSFGSSLVPLLIQDYKTVTLVDIRYISSAYLEEVMDFHGQDVLFLYSTLVLNSSNSLK